MFRKALWLGVVVYFLSAFWASFTRDRVPEIKGLYRQRDTWSLRVARRKAENRYLREQIAGLKSDFRYTEKILREELLLYKKGELVVLVPAD
ncbi:septum formation initiator family protein [bacterium]|nr:septum formation initiator family protein [bacterium]